MDTQTDITSQRSGEGLGVKKLSPKGEALGCTYNAIIDLLSNK